MKGVINIINWEDYFKSEAHFYVFTLCEMDGKSRCDMLGIKHIHYYSSEKAKKWKDNIENILSKSDVKQEYLLSALGELYRLYNVMTDNVEDVVKIKNRKLRIKF